jgi:hypothetical protein
MAARSQKFLPGRVLFLSSTAPCPSNGCARFCYNLRSVTIKRMAIARGAIV